MSQRSIAVRNLLLRNAPEIGIEIKASGVEVARCEITGSVDDAIRVIAHGALLGSARP